MQQTIRTGLDVDQATTANFNPTSERRSRLHLCHIITSVYFRCPSAIPRNYRSRLRKQSGRLAVPYLSTAMRDSEVGAARVRQLRVRWSLCAFSTGCMLTVDSSSERICGRAMYAPCMHHCPIRLFHPMIGAPSCCTARSRLNLAG